MKHFAVIDEDADKNDKQKKLENVYCYKPQSYK